MRRTMLSSSTTSKLGGSPKPLGLQVTGTLGVLLQAKQSGLLPSVRAVITILEKRGTWIARALVAKAIRLAGE
jgi:uncharacterized protein